MPQLDISNYSSQVFWLALCFIFLYLYISNIIIPRINKIITNRKNIIDEDTNKSFILQQEINRLQERSQEIRSNSNNEYKSKIDRANKRATDYKTITLLKLKDRIETMSINSKNDIIQFITHSEQQREKIVKDFIILIKSKLFKS